MQTCAIQVHAEDSGTESCEHDLRPVGRECRLAPRLAAGRDLLEAAAGRLDAKELRGA
jgi:hypothetical protein